MTTLAKHIIVAGAENRPPMLEKSLYDSWAICICLFIKGKKSGRMMLDLIDEDNLFDKFTSVQGETLYEYYWRFSQLINDMHTIGITMQQVQVNTKFLNALPPEWSKFITDVKLAKILYTTNYDQLYAYLTEFPQLDFGLTVPTFQQGENLIECINKVMTFLSVVASRFPPSNNQLRTSFNPRNQVTIQDGRVIVQQVQGRQTQSFAGTRNKGIATTSWGNYATGQAKEKLMLVEAQEAGCNDISSAKAVLMANLSSCDSDVLYEIPYSDTYPNDMINQDDTTSSAPTDLLVLSLVEQITDHVANLDKESQTNKMVIKSLTAELERYKELPGTRYSRYLHLSIAAFGVKLGKVLTIFPVMYLSAGTCVMFIITAAIVSFLGAIMGVGYCTIIWVDIIATGRVVETVYDPPHTVTSEASRIQSILSALAIISLAFRGHNVVLEIQATMPSTPNRPSIMLMRNGVTASYFIISICFFPLAIVGYWTFGNEMLAKGGLLTVLSMTLHLHRSKPVLGLIYIQIVISCFTAFQIYSMVIFDNLERVYSSRTSNKCSKLSRIGIRIFFGGLTFFISVAFPFLPSLTFLGGIALPLTYGYPCLMWIAIKKPPKKSGSWWLNLGLGCSCIGLSVLVVVGSVWNLVTTGLDANFFHPR
ncbi:lysine histidine transporter-like 8 protein [Tanacetum coccineum]|uniref:Lysine histidine transporter-like 8 protein n=1 Tax=Tanacetum coccineum TaxID=301880 RepID=A0ABQ4XHZ1_9ASTR